MINDDERIDEKMPVDEEIKFNMIPIVVGIKEKIELKGKNESVDIVPEM